MCRPDWKMRKATRMADDALKEGDTVIVTGNVNLAHEAPVKVVEN